MLTLLLVTRLSRASGRREFVLLGAVALALRVPAWLAPPAHSDDVYRHAWGVGIELVRDLEARRG